MSMLFICWLMEESSVRFIFIELTIMNNSSQSNIKDFNSIHFTGLTWKTMSTYYYLKSIDSIKVGLEAKC